MAAPKTPGPDYSAVLAKGVRGAVAKAVPALDGERLGDLMTELFGVADSAFASVVAKDPPRRTIACKAGCAYCCHLYVQVTPLEAIHLARALRARGAEALAAVQGRVAAAHRKTAGKDAEYRNFLAVPCPLLRDGQCSVYEERAFGCRGANSADADACRRGMGNSSSVPLPTFVHQRNIYAAVGNGAAHGLLDAGARPNVLELIAALHLALAHEDPLRAWQSGEIDFEPARCREAGKRV